MFSQLREKFELAESTTKIQGGTLEEITRIIGRLRQEERYWQEKPNVDPKDAFMLYHALRNARLVAQKLKIRVIAAPQANDNPQVASDGVMVLPTLEVIVKKGEEYKSRKMTAETRKEFYALVSRLRVEARKFHLLPSAAEDREEMTGEDLQEQSKALARTLEPTIGSPSSNS